MNFETKDRTKQKTEQNKKNKEDKTDKRDKSFKKIDLNYEEIIRRHFLGAEKKNTDKILNDKCRIDNKHYF